LKAVCQWWPGSCKLELEVTVAWWRGQSGTAEWTALARRKLHSDTTKTERRRCSRSDLHCPAVISSAPVTPLQRLHSLTSDASAAAVLCPLTRCVPSAAGQQHHFSRPRATARPGASLHHRMHIGRSVASTVPLICRPAGAAAQAAAVAGGGGRKPEPEGGCGRPAKAALPKHSSSCRRGASENFGAACQWPAAEAQWRGSSVCPTRKLRAGRASAGPAARPNSSGVVTSGTRTVFFV
jgi:hypothetical protein